MRQQSDAYFVRIHPDPPPVGRGGDAPVAGRSGLGAPARPHRRRHRRPSGRPVLVAILVIALGAWLAWASQRPGGVSGTVNGWISHVRGEVAKVSSDPDLGRARTYFSQQYKAQGRYPQMSEADLAGVGIGVGVSVAWCGPQAVVIQGASGGGTSSRLLLSGQDLGELPAAYPCPASLADPAPWKLKH